MRYGARGKTQRGLVWGLGNKYVQAGWLGISKAGLAFFGMRSDFWGFFLFWPDPLPQEKWWTVVINFAETTYTGTFFGPGPVGRS